MELTSALAGLLVRDDDGLTDEFYAALYDYIQGVTQCHGDSAEEVKTRVQWVV